MLEPSEKQIKKEECSISMETYSHRPSPYKRDNVINKSTVKKRDENKNKK
ncbi:hypothetical protein N8E87_04960 [Avibacterium paragallinarum]|nr:hypothetical protein [Avibacterium paragallinarum]UXN37815.1 hypothetical protein N8E87_04960 [Avibacterium paragallinarum]